MNNYHGGGKKGSFFEGWYVRLSGDAGTIAFIPGISINHEGKKTAFIQVVGEQGSYYIPYPVSAFACARHQPAVRVGKNLFTEKGARLSIHTEGLDCEGTVRYGALAPLRYDIMGPFHGVPFMQCNHGVISMRHALSGSITLNGRRMDFTGGTGYIEKDWGTSFPQSYLWVQCNRFIALGARPCAVMASVADIPFLGTSFLGCICAVQYGKKEYRLATYTGAHVLRWDAGGLVLKQGGAMLVVDVQKVSPQVLKAPKQGNMCRTIREHVSCAARFRFFVHNSLLFDYKGIAAGFEYVPK